MCSVLDARAHHQLIPWTAAPIRTRTLDAGRPLLGRAPHPSRRAPTKLGSQSPRYRPARKARRAPTAGPRITPASKRGGPRECRPAWPGAGLAGPGPAPQDLHHPWAATKSIRRRPVQPRRGPEPSWSSWGPRVCRPPAGAKTRPFTVTGRPPLRAKSPRLQLARWRAPSQVPAVLLAGPGRPDGAKPQIRRAVAPSVREPPPERNARRRRGRTVHRNGRHVNGRQTPTSSCRSGSPSPAPVVPAGVRPPSRRGAPLVPRRAGAARAGPGLRRH